MNTDAMLEASADTQDGTSSPEAAVYVDRALGMLRAHLLERTARNEWDEKRAQEMAQAIVTCLRESADVPVGEPNSRTAGLSRDCLRRAVRFIHQNLDTNLSWVQMASEVGLPPFSFGRSFKVTTGLTPYQYVIRCRIRKAMNLLATSDQSICDIALDVGCSCQSHLTTLFRKHTGTTPGAFRAASRRGGRRSMAAPAPAASVSASRFA